VFILALAAALALPAGLDASTATTPRAALLDQLGLFRQGKFRQEYDTMFTANFRARCPWARFLRNSRRDRRLIGARFTIGTIRTRMLSSTRALLAYRVTTGDRKYVIDVTFRHRDIYARVGNYWYDELDRVTACPA
jgi:hypothetical protein